jgi:hypothetical protein
MSVAGHPAFGMFADREDMKDVHAWLRKIRTPRYLREGGTLSSPPPQKSRRKRKSQTPSRNAFMGDQEPSRPTCKARIRVNEKGT